MQDSERDRGPRQMTNPCQGHAAESARAEKPEALRLADELDEFYKTDGIGGVDEAAAELRRLHALCEEMGEALDEMLTKFTKAQSTLKESEARIKAHAALTKWKESK